MAETPTAPTPEEPTSGPAPEDDRAAAPSEPPASSAEQPGLPEQPPAAEETISESEPEPPTALPAEAAIANTAEVTAPAAAPVEPSPEPEQPSVATTLTAPAAGDTGQTGFAGDEPGSEGGGEWELLLEKLNGWFRSGRLQEQLAAARRPITLVGSLIALLLVLRVYGAVLRGIDSLPLVPGLLELVGVIALVQFSFTRLVRSRERQQLIETWRHRWNDFRGKAG